MSDKEKLKRSSIKGGMTTALESGVSTIVVFAQTMILARLLTPDDFGVVAMGVVVTTLATMLASFGLSTASIQKKSLSHLESSSLFWLNITIGVCAYVVIFVIAPIISSVYQDSRVTDVLRIQALALIINAAISQHIALLKRDIRHGSVAIALICGSIGNLSISVCTAMMGFEYWSIVSGYLGGLLISGTINWFLSGFSPSLNFSYTKVKSFLGFGTDVLGFSLANYVTRNLDNFLIGRNVGSAELGMYSRAYALMMLPISRLRAPIVSVSLPVMSRLYHSGDSQELRNIYRSICRALAAISMPLVAVMIVLTDEMVGILFGSSWEGVGDYFRLLAIVAFIQPVISIRGVLLLACGQSRRYLKMGLINAVVVSAGFLVGVQWGARGIAISYIITQYLLLYPLLYYSTGDTPVKVRDFNQSVLKPFISTCIALFVGHYLYGMVDCSPLLQIIGIGAAMMSVYFVIYSLIPGGMSELKNFRSILVKGIKSSKKVKM